MLWRLFRAKTGRLKKPARKVWASPCGCDIINLLFCGNVGIALCYFMYAIDGDLKLANPGFPTESETEYLATVGVSPLSFDSCTTEGSGENERARHLLNTDAGPFLPLSMIRKESARSTPAARLRHSPDRGARRRCRSQCRRERLLHRCRYRCRSRSL